MSHPWLLGNSNKREGEEGVLAWFNSAELLNSVMATMGDVQVCLDNLAGKGETCLLPLNEYNFNPFVESVMNACTCIFFRYYQHVAAYGLWHKVEALTFTCISILYNNRVPLLHGPTLPHVYSTVITAVELRSVFPLTTDNPQLVLVSEFGGKKCFPLFHRSGYEFTKKLSISPLTVSEKIYCLVV